MGMAIAVQFARHDFEVRRQPFVLDHRLEYSP